MITTITSNSSSVMDVLLAVDLDLAYLSEKLVNLHVLLTHTLTWDDFEEMNDGRTMISDESIERALVFDFSSRVLEGEVLELERNMNMLWVKLLDTRQRIYVCRHEREIFDVLSDKLCDSEKSWEQFKERIVEMKMLSANLQLSPLPWLNQNCKVDSGVDIKELESPIITNPLMQSGQKRHILWMLEKSLAGELDLERKYLDTRERGEELHLKLRHREHVMLHLKKASEAAWANYIEADNAAEVLLATSRDSLRRLQVVQFNLNVSLQRENDLKCQLENLCDQLKLKEEAVQKLQELTTVPETGISSRHEEYKIVMLGLNKQVKPLEDKLKESEIRSQTSNGLHVVKHGQVKNVVDTKRETTADTENRVDNVEARLSTLTKKNLELMEEMRFLNTNDINAEKVSLLKKQLRDLEILLQNANAAAKASQEQYSTLCTRIRSMDTLIDDWKSKVSKYEIQIESTKEHHLLLLESNIELNKDASILKERLKFVKALLEEADSKKLAISADINFRSKIIMDMIEQIGTERERIQKQLNILVDENKDLRHKLHIECEEIYGT